MKSETLVGFSAFLAFSASATACLVPTVGAAQERSANTAPVQFIDSQNQTFNDTRIIAANASHNKVAVIAWGGNRALQQEAYNAARDLSDMGIPIAFVLGPDLNGFDVDIHIQVYARSTPRADGRYGNDFVRDVRQDTRRAGINAYREAFPREAAALKLTP